MNADLVVVGAGIAGLAHAYLAARSGLRVVVVEQSQRAAGASVRNFGLIWPVGQPAERYSFAMRSREIWMELLREARLYCNSSGSLHLAYCQDEWQVLQEFAAKAPSLGFVCELKSPTAVLAASPAARPAGLLGGLFSPTEITVDPRQVIAQLPAFLAERYGVHFRFGVSATVETLGEAERSVVCLGAERSQLFAAELRESGLSSVKLQMMRTDSQGTWRLGPALAAGLTLRYYPAFRICTELKNLELRIAAETPEYDRWGIHVLLSQTADGSITVGDSHEYGADAEKPFNLEEIDALILRNLAGFAALPDGRIRERWHGVYVKHAHLPFIRLAPNAFSRVVTGFGGAGMTLSMAAAEQTLREWDRR